MLRCMSPQLALSGLVEMVCKLSALRGEADMRDRVTSTSSVAIDPRKTTRVPSATLAFSRRYFP
jgi:hypothetical protein